MTFFLQYLKRKICAKIINAPARPLPMSMSYGKSRKWEIRFYNVLLYSARCDADITIGRLLVRPSSAVAAVPTWFSRTLHRCRSVCSNPARNSSNSTPPFLYTILNFILKNDLILWYDFRIIYIYMLYYKLSSSYSHI